MSPNVRHGKGTPTARVIADREMGVKMGRSLLVVHGVVQVAEVPADQVSAGRVGREDRGAVVKECGRAATSATTVRADSARILALVVVAFLAALEVAFLAALEVAFPVVLEWDRGDAISFRKTPKWPR